MHIAAVGALSVAPPLFFFHISWIPRQSLICARFLLPRRHTRYRQTGCQQRDLLCRQLTCYRQTGQTIPCCLFVSCKTNCKQLYASAGDLRAHEAVCNCAGMFCAVCCAAAGCLQQYCTGNASMLISRISTGTHDNLLLCPELSKSFLALPHCFILTQVSLSLLLLIVPDHERAF